MAKKRPRRRRAKGIRIPKWVVLLTQKIELLEAEERRRAAKRNGH